MTAFFWLVGILSYFSIGAGVAVAADLAADKLGHAIECRPVALTFIAILWPFFCLMVIASRLMP